MLIHLVTDHADHFSHGKCGKDRTDSKSVQMSEDDASHQSCYGKAGNVIADFDPGIFYLCDICQSLGNRSVGMIGRPQRLESAIPMHRSR